LTQNRSQNDCRHSYNRGFDFIPSRPGVDRRESGIRLLPFEDDQLLANSGSFQPKLVARDKPRANTGESRKKRPDPHSDVMRNGITRSLANDSSHSHIRSDDRQARDAFAGDSVDNDTLCGLRWGAPNQQHQAAVSVPHCSRTFPLHPSHRPICQSEWTPSASTAGVQITPYCQQEPDKLVL